MDGGAVADCKRRGSVRCRMLRLRARPDRPYELGDDQAAAQGLQSKARDAYAYEPDHACQAGRSESRGRSSRRGRVFLEFEKKGAQGDRRGGNPPPGGGGGAAVRRRRGGGRPPRSLFVESLYQY